MRTGAERPGTTRPKRSILRSLAFSLGATLAVLVLLVAGGLLWIALRPPPEGFAPTTGEAAGAAGPPPGSPAGDLAFRRTDNLTNGGETNPQGLGGAVDLGEVPLEEASPLADGYLADATDDERGLENPALNKWYSYNWTTHVITSKNHTYALRTATGEVALLTFVSYYCDDGSSGCITFRYLYPFEP